MLKRVQLGPWDVDLGWLGKETRQWTANFAGMYCSDVFTTSCVPSISSKTIKQKKKTYAVCLVLGVVKMLI